MLQNTRVTAFTVFELLRENQLGGWGEGGGELIRVKLQGIHQNSEMNV